LLTEVFELLKAGEETTAQSHAARHRGGRAGRGIHRSLTQPHGLRLPHSSS